jgi:lipopolysaccharide transport system ATP-binding protein
LRDVSFEVKRGEVLGVIGRNGAGKSTLLKLLSRITPPTTGRVEVRGRVGTLLEVGTGFHPELTGRENVFLNGAILGMRRAEIKRKFDEIVDFAGVEQFIDTPVKRYSSGMYVRLAFAVAAHFEPEIMLVDEVLAVGDAEFQKKCLGKMGDVAKGGRTVLFVSHNLAAIENLCSRVLLIEMGRGRHFAAAAAGVREYLRELINTTRQDLAVREDRQGTQIIRFTGFTLHDEHGRPLASLQCGRKCFLRFAFENPRRRELGSLGFAVGIDDQMGLRVAHLGECAEADLSRVPADVRSIEIRIDKLPLMPGRYFFTIFSTVDGQIADWVQQAGSFLVDPGDYFGNGKLPPQGVVLVEHAVRYSRGEPTP